MDVMNDIEKRYPHDVQLEQDIIATCARNPENINLLPTNVLDMFFRPELRELMSVVIELVEKNVNPNSIKVDEVLSRDLDRYQRCGGFANVTFVLTKAWDIDTNFPHNLNEFIDYYKRREFIKQCEVTAAMARNLVDDGYEDYLREQLENINKNVYSSVDELPDIRKIAMDIVDDIKDGVKEKRILFGIKEIDEKLNGVTPGSLNVVGGRTGMGKTAVSCALATNMYLLGNRVLYFNLEMTDRQVVGRIMAGVSEIPYRAFADGSLTVKSLDKLGEAYRALAPDENSSFHICSRGGLTVEDVCRISNVQSINHGLDVIFVDYLAMLDIPGVEKNSHISYGEVARKLKALAMKLNVAVFLLVQGNRESENASDKRMTIASIAGSDRIAHEADNVFLLYREAYYTHEKNDTLEINHAKARNSYPRTFRTLFSLENMRFYDAPLDGEIQDKKVTKEAKEAFKK